MNVMPVGMACHTKLGYKSPAEEHFLTASRERKTRAEHVRKGCFELGAHGRTRTAGLLLTKEVLMDQFPTGAMLRSNSAAIANNCCLAALPTKSPRQLQKLLEQFQAKRLGRWPTCTKEANMRRRETSGSSPSRRAVRAPGHQLLNAK